MGPYIWNHRAKKRRNLKRRRAAILSSHLQQASSAPLFDIILLLFGLVASYSTSWIMPINTCVWKPLWLRFQEKRLRIHRAQDAKQSTKLTNHGPQFIFFDSDCEGFFWKKGWQQRLSSMTAQFRLSLKTAQLICHQRLLDLECRQDYPT